MIHIDIKKLGRFARSGHRVTGNRQGCRNAGAGWEYVHVAIDDHSRVAFAKIMASEKKRSAVAFLKAALTYYESLGIKVERVMTDNGACYKSFAFRRACKRLEAASRPDQTLHAKNQRKGRTLHPIQPARVGLCTSLSDLATAKGRTTVVAPPLQLAQTSRGHR